MKNCEKKRINSNLNLLYKLRIKTFSTILYLYNSFIVIFYTYPNFFTLVYVIQRFMIKTLQKLSRKY